MEMRTFDLTPLFRSTIGFDHLARMIDSAARLDEQAVSYPPYNIEKIGDDSYRIVMAIAGFSENEIDITSEGNRLTIVGRARKDEDSVQYLYRGIAGRSFERRFDLADHIMIKDATMANGLLYISLERLVPEAMRPRSIRIAAGVPPTTALPPRATVAPKAVDTTAETETVPSGTV